MKNAERIVYICVITLCFIGMANGCGKLKRMQGLLDSVNDTLTKTINKKGQEKATTDLLLGSIKDLKSMHVADSSTIGKLQKMVDKNTMSATYLSNVTANHVDMKEQSVSMKDTVKKGGIIYVYPEYKDTINDRWQNIKIRANKDSLHFDYKVFNEFDIKQEWKRNGLFKRKTAEVSILNLNPHTETLVYKTFTVQENKSNRLRDMLIGAAISLIAVEAISIPIHFK